MRIAGAFFSALLLLAVSLASVAPLSAQAQFSPRERERESAIFDPRKPQIFADIGLGPVATILGVSNDFTNISTGRGLGFTGNLYATLINLLGFQLPLSYSSFDNLDSASLDHEDLDREYLEESSESDASGSAWSVEPRLGLMLLVAPKEPEYFFLYVGYRYAKGEASTEQNEFAITQSGLTFGFEDVSLIAFPNNFGVGFITGLGLNFAAPEEYEDEEGTQPIEDSGGVGLFYKFGLRFQKDLWYLQLHYSADVGAGAGKTPDGEDLIAVVGTAGLYLNFGLYF